MFVSTKLLPKCQNFVILLVIMLNINIVNFNEDYINVRIENGIIKGRTESVDGKQLKVFLGIPYAEPPIGDLRFKKPLPMKAWSEPIHALQWPKACQQQKFYPETIYLNKEMSEDCLHLNIWSPSGQNESDDKLRPVMFYIYGGALAAGTSVEDHYSGHILAAKGDVLVVTINYRVNTFGFLYTGTADAPGNMGLWDQALALEWVSDNIRYFGGDPNRITLFGQSAGAWSVSLHILSPVTRHLFRNAIIMSGAAINAIAGEEPETILNNWLKGAKAVGCADRVDKEFSPKIIKCIHRTPTEVLTSIPWMPALTTGTSDKWMSQVVIDGEFIPYRPTEMLNNNDCKQSFNLLVGTTENEGPWLPLGDESSTANMTFNEAYNEVIRISSELNSKEPINGEDVAKMYFMGLSTNTGADLLRRTIGIAIGDFLLGCPPILFAKTLFRNDIKSNVFQYYFNSKVGKPKLLCSHWKGVCHMDEVYPVFGVPFYQSEKYLDKERDISEQMIKIFTDFAKTGKPSAQNGTEWPQYYRVNDQTIAPYYEITAEPKAKTNFGIGLKINECEYLWKRYIDRQ